MESKVFDRIRERTSPEIKQRVKIYGQIIVGLSNEQSCLFTGAMQGEFDDVLPEYRWIPIPENNEKKIC